MLHQADAVCLLPRCLQQGGDFEALPVLRETKTQQQAPSVYYSGHFFSTCTRQPLQGCRMNNQPLKKGIALQDHVVSVAEGPIPRGQAVLRDLLVEAVSSRG